MCESLCGRLFFQPSPLGKEGSPRSPAPTLWRSIAHCHLGKAGVSLGSCHPSGMWVKRKWAWTLHSIPSLSSIKPGILTLGWMSIITQSTGSSIELIVTVLCMLHHYTKAKEESNGGVKEVFFHFLAFLNCKTNKTFVWLKYLEFLTAFQCLPKLISLSVEISAWLLHPSQLCRCPWHRLACPAERNHRKQAARQEGSQTTCPPHSSSTKRAPRSFGGAHHDHLIALFTNGLQEWM